MANCEIKSFPNFKNIKSYTSSLKRRVQERYLNRKTNKVTTIIMVGSFTENLILLTR